MLKLKSGECLQKCESLMGSRGEARKSVGQANKGARVSDSGFISEN